MILSHEIEGGNPFRATKCKAENCLSDVTLRFRRNLLG